MSENKTTTNQVRQILMNELGLTRESIREEMKKIVEQTVDTRIRQLINEYDFKETVRQATIDQLKKGDVRKIVGDEARKKALEMLDQMYPSDSDTK